MKTKMVLEMVYKHVEREKSQVRSSKSYSIKKITLSYFPIIRSHIKLEW